MKLIFVYFFTLSIGILIVFGIASLVARIFPGLKIIVFIILSVYWAFIGWKYAKYQTKNSLQPNLIKPESFPIGPYKLNMQIKDFEEFNEISTSEYEIFPKKFKDEIIYKAPSINFLGIAWDVMLGTINGKIYKISPGYKTKDKNEADEIAMKTLSYCKSKLGEPSEKQTGYFIWDTIDGNVILQIAETSEVFVIYLFSTSRNIRYAQVTQHP